MLKISRIIFRIHQPKPAFHMTPRNAVATSQFMTYRMIRKTQKSESGAHSTGEVGRTIHLALLSVCKSASRKASRCRTVLPIPLHLALAMPNTASVFTPPLRRGTSLELPISTYNRAGNTGYDVGVRSTVIEWASMPAVSMFG